MIEQLGVYDRTAVPDLINATAFIPFECGKEYWQLDLVGYDVVEQIGAFCMGGAINEGRLSAKIIADLTGADEKDANDVAVYVAEFVHDGIVSYLAHVYVAELK